MTRFPGHREYPDHKVKERHLNPRMRVAVAGETIADSSDVIKVRRMAVRRDITFLVATSI